MVGVGVMVGVDVGMAPNSGLQAQVISKLPGGG